MDVTAWLNEMALDRYAEAFAENDIDGETLAALTEDDLRELGVASLGHRKKIMAASTTPGETSAASSSSAADAPRAQAVNGAR